MIWRLFSVYKAGKFIYEFYQGLKKDAEEFDKKQNKENVIRSKKPKRKSQPKRNPKGLQSRN